MSLFCLAICCLFLVFFRGLGMENMPDLYVIPMIAIFSFVYLGQIESGKKYRGVASTFIYGYVLRLFLVFVDVYLKKYFLLPNSGADSEMFYMGAIRYMYEGGFARGYFVKVMAAVFLFFGISRLWAQFLLMLCSVAALHFAHKTMIECKASRENIKRVMMVLCLLPNSTILSCIFVRESLIYMFVSISLYCFVRWMTRKDELFYILSFISAFMAMRFHAGTVAIPIAYGIVRILYDSKKEVYSFQAKNIVVSVVILAIAGYIAMRFQDEYLGKLGRLDNMDNLGVIANTRDVGGSSYAKYVGDSSSPLHFIIFTPLRIFFFLFSPLPIFWRSVADIIAFCFSSMFYMWALVAARRFLKQIHHGLHRNLVIACLIIAVCAVFVFGWGVSNAGTACRHREKVSSLFGLILALALPPRKNKLLSLT